MLRAAAATCQSGARSIAAAVRMSIARTLSLMSASRRVRHPGLRPSRFPVGGRVTPRRQHLESGNRNAARSQGGGFKRPRYSPACPHSLLVAFCNRATDCPADSFVGSMAPRVTRGQIQTAQQLPQVTERIGIRNVPSATARGRRGAVPWVVQRSSRLHAIEQLFRSLEWQQALARWQGNRLNPVS
jgi:hypothetical protein